MRAFLLATLLIASGATAQTTHVVQVRNFSFSPATLTIESGDTVRWINDQGVHNVSQLSGTEAFGNALASGWTYEFTFTGVGTSTYQCDAHAGAMQGSVSVTPVTSTETPPEALASLDLASANPFIGVARLTLSLGQPKSVRAVVYDARGREVEVLHDGPATKGETDLVWTAGEARPGIYVVRVTGPGISLSKGLSLAGRAGDHSGGH